MDFKIDMVITDIYRKRRNSTILTINPIFSLKQIFLLMFWNNCPFSMIFEMIIPGTIKIHVISGASQNLKYVYIKNPVFYLTATYNCH